MKLLSDQFLSVRYFSLVLIILASRLVAGTDKITYQGRLEKDGMVMNGSVSVRIKIFDTVTGGTELYTTSGPQIVTNGEFTTLLGPFDPGVFNGADRWVEIAVSDTGIAGGNYVPLVPRQPIYATPYALRAMSATTITGSVNPSSLASGTTTGTINFNPASGAPFIISNSSSPVVTNLNADKLDGFDSSAFVNSSGGIMTGTLELHSPALLSFGDTTRQMLNLKGSEYGFGVQSDTLYSRSAVGFSWFSGGGHSDLTNDPGTGGSILMSLNSTSGLTVNGPVNGTGNALIPSINAMNPASAGTAVYGTVSETDAFPIFGQGPDGGYGSKFVCNGNNGWAVYGVSDTGYAGYFEGNVYATGDLTVVGNMSSTGALSGYFMSNRDQLDKSWALYSRDGFGIDQFAIWSADTGDVASFSANGDAYLVGTLSAKNVTIRGGADIAEPFSMTKNHDDPLIDYEPGTVVVIDDDNPGKLKISTSAYDKKVAGIISGAGGVNPGLRLHQEGVMEGNQHVALSGRVYVKADASVNPIRPGDLLTTSPKPGYAMKVIDSNEAQGAILGKAMSRLEDGTGLVLVLVTLQ